MGTTHPRLEGRAVQGRECTVSEAHHGWDVQAAAAGLSWEPWREVRADDTDVEVSEYGCLKLVTVLRECLENEKRIQGDCPLRWRRRATEK